MVTKLLTILLIFSFVFTQEPCEGTCLSEEETINLFHNIQELEFKDSTNTEIIENLNSQIYMYIQLSENDSLLVLKQDEKIMQKQQIARSKSRKLAKDW